MSLKITVRDPGHLEAHRAEFLIPLEDVMKLATEALERLTPRSGEWELFSTRCPRPVGHSGLKRIRPWTRGDYWAPRAGRSIPSHLIRARRRPTRHLCVWGFWGEGDSFIIHTLYPGKPAPREIHDPELAVGELSRSVRFWSRHAIIIEET